MTILCLDFWDSFLAFEFPGMGHQDDGDGYHEAKPVHLCSSSRFDCCSFSTASTTTTTTTTASTTVSSRDDSERNGKVGLCFNAPPKSNVAPLRLLQIKQRDENNRFEMIQMLAAIRSERQRREREHCRMTAAHKKRMQERQRKWNKWEADRQAIMKASPPCVWIPHRRYSSWWSPQDGRRDDVFVHHPLK